MPATTIDKVEHFTLEGPFGLPAAMIIVAALLILFTWSLHRERGILGQRHTILFWLLRAAALLTVVWMLLAPTNVKTEISTSRQSVAFVTDVSGSMRTIDPPGTADGLRWAVSQKDVTKFTATRAADRAVAAAAIAERRLQQASDALIRHQRESVVVEATSAAKNAIQRVRDNLAVVEEQYGGGVSQDSSSGRRFSLSVQILKALDGPEFKTFSSLASALKKGRTPSQKGWRESLPDLEHRMSGIGRQLRELAQGVGEHETQLAEQNSPALLTALAKTPRLTRATTFLEALHADVLTELQQKVDIRHYSFDLGMTQVSSQSDPAGEIASRQPQVAAGNEIDEDEDETARLQKTGTDVSAVLEHLNRIRQDQTLAAAVILSDVHHNFAPAVDPRDVAGDLKGTPVYVVPIGNTQHVRDVMLQSVFVPNVAMRNDDIVIEATVQAHDCSGESCFVQLLQDGDEIDQRVVEIDSGFATRKIRFERKMSEIGTQRFQIAITPLAGELTDRNNFDDFEVNVTRSDIKLLLADDLPRWEYRYLAQLFRRDTKVECDELLFRPRLIATGRREETGTFPTTVDEWDQYDVVLLGDLPPEKFSAASQESMIEYMTERGGTVILIAGSNAMPQAYVDHPLEHVLPVSASPAAAETGTDIGYSFHVTEEGLNEPALMIGLTQEATRTAWLFVNEFSPIYELSTWRQPRASAHTLIAAVPRGTLDVEYAARQNALLCWQPVGRGMVVYLSAPDTWRLRLLRGDQLHYRFWGQLLRWAIWSDLSAGSDVVRIRPDKSRYRMDDTVRVVVRLTDTDGSPVVSEGLRAVARREPEERFAPLVPDPRIPGQYAAEFRSLPAGVYNIQAVGDQIDRLLQASGQDVTMASFTVQADLPVELLDTRCDRALGQQIADVTGGQVVPPTAIEEVLGLTNLEPEISERIETRPLWLQWKYLWIVFGCLQTEWIIRKWQGLS